MVPSGNVACSVKATKAAASAMRDDMVHCDAISRNFVNAKPAWLTSFKLGARWKCRELLLGSVGWGGSSRGALGRDARSSSESDSVALPGGPHTIMVSPKLLLRSVRGGGSSSGASGRDARSSSESDSVALPGGPHTMTVSPPVFRLHGEFSQGTAGSGLRIAPTCGWVGRVVSICALTSRCRDPH